MLLTILAKCFTSLLQFLMSCPVSHIKLLEKIFMTYSYYFHYQVKLNTLSFIPYILYNDNDSLKNLTNLFIIFP